jgi:hypothetical protein
MSNRSLLNSITYEEWPVLSYSIFTHAPNQSRKNKIAKIFSLTSIAFIVLAWLIFWHILPAWAAQPTIINSIPNQIAVENNLFDFTFGINTFGDTDNDVLTYSAQLAGGGALPAWLSFDGATRTFSGTPSNGDVGTINIEVTANDGGATVTDIFNLEVQNMGSSNEIYETSGSAGDTQTLSAGVPLYQSFFHDSVGPTYSVGSVTLQLVKDPAASAQTITASLLSSSYNGVVLASDTLSSADIDTTVGWETFTFAGEALDDNQLYFIKVETSSADGLVRAGIHTTNVYANGSFHSSTGVADTSRDLAFQVASGSNNNPVQVNPIPNQNATEDAAFNFQFASDTFNDPDDDTLTYSAQLPEGGALPAWLSFDALTRTFSGTPTNGDVGTISVAVIADDGFSGTVTDIFDIVVANSNDAPTIANAIPNQNATEDAAFNFVFASNTFTDQDVGNTLTYTAQLAGGGALPAWLDFDAATRTFSGTPLNAHVGTVAIDVTANDGNGGTVTDTFNIVVANSNDVPTIANAIANQNATESVAFNFQFALNTFNDSDIGDTLTYTAQLAGGGSIPAWLSFDPATRTFSGTPTNGDVGTISLDVIANDGNGGTVTDTFTIVVAAAGGSSVTLPPTMNAPVSNATYGLISVDFELGETPLADSMSLIFVGDDTIVINLQIGNPAVGPYEYFINPTDVMATGAPFASASQNTIPDGVYTVVLSYQNANGDPAASVSTTNVTVSAASIDTDSDGSLDSVEQAAPNDGDANNDSIADSEQANVISYVNPITGNYAVFETDCESIAGFQVGSESSEYPDTGYSYPFGLAGFQISCASSGDTATIKHYYYGIEGSDRYSVRKWLPDGSYTTITGAQNLGALIDGQVVFLTQYEITDGGDYDDDGTANGVIVDPSGAALEQDLEADSAASPSLLANTGASVLLVSFLSTLLLLASTLGLARLKSKR